MAKITPLSLYIVNRVMFRRMVLGISAWYFATLIEKSESFVYKIEDPEVQAQYNPHDYPIVAQALKWTVEDLLPPDDWDAGDGTKVEKIVLSLTNPEDTRLVLEGMIEYGILINRRHCRKSSSICTSTVKIRRRSGRYWSGYWRIW